MKRTLTILFAITTACSAAELVVPEGTRIHVRLVQSLSLSAVHPGERLDFTVTHPVRIDGAIVIPAGARAVGTVERVNRHMIESGSVSFSIGRVRAVDGRWIPIRYSASMVRKVEKALVDGALNSSAAMAAGPGAPLLVETGENLCRQIINKGGVQRGYEVYAAANVTVHVRHLAS